MDDATSEALAEKLAADAARYADVEAEIAKPEVIANQTLYASLLKELGMLRAAADMGRELADVDRKIADDKAIVAEADDEELVGMAGQELAELEVRRAELLRRARDELLLDDSESHRSVIMEIRGGTGGDEASLFAADLFRMYQRYADARGWRVEVLASSPTNLGGFKEIVFNVKGAGAHKRLRYESGVHRVQRVPVTESQGRIHTSAATVAVLPEVEDIEVEIRDEDIRVDTFRAGGPGGQSVNKTSSAVRVTHLPTGVVVSCQDEKSQHKNRSRAMKILRSRLYAKTRAERDKSRSAARRSLVGSGDRSERIRTYNFPDNRVTDHRIKLTLYDLENILLGRLDPIIDALIEHDKAERLKEL
jgi:peptide chain release factor 1